MDEGTLEHQRASAGVSAGCAATFASRQILRRNCNEAEGVTDVDGIKGSEFFVPLEGLHSASRIANANPSIVERLDCDCRDVEAVLWN